MKRINDIPTCYLYQSADGWHRSDAELTKEINRHIFYGRKFDPAGRTFYPQWPEPTDKSTTKVAWILTPDGERAARWEWVERDHKKTHAHCELTKQGRCRSKMLIRLSYDSAKKLWTQVTNEQENPT